MPKFSAKSQAKLATCHPLLQTLFNEVIKYVDCTIIEGARTKETQEEYVRTGKSKTMNSKHLPQQDGTSWAVDCMVCPIEWNNQQRNYMFAGYVKGIANKMGIELRIGADWDGDFTTKDQSFHDLPHFELKSTVRSGGAEDAVKNKPSSYLPDGPSEDDINTSLEDLEKDLD